ncbi:MAG: SDR family oxidoreductase [Gammaproteobacteria bacterium]
MPGPGFGVISPRKVGVIFGGGRLNGIGACTAFKLAPRYDLVINCRKNEDQARQVAQRCEQFGAKAHVFMGDISQSSTCKEMASFVKHEFGRVDSLVNCAGITKSAAYDKLDQLTPEDFDNIFRVNVTSNYLLAQEFKDLLTQTHELIDENGEKTDTSFTLVTSAAGITGQGSSMAYAASKAAQINLMQGLAKSFAPFSRVNAVAPSFVNSSWWDEAFAGKEDKYNALLQSMQRNNILNKVLKPVDVASLIVSIIDNPAITGEVYRIDAGAHIGSAKPQPTKSVTEQAEQSSGADNTLNRK